MGLVGFEEEETHTMTSDIPRGITAREGQEERVGGRVKVEEEKKVGF